MRGTLVALLLYLVSFPLLADDTFVVETKITVGDLVLGSPTISVNAGTNAKVAAQGQYELSLIAIPQDDDQVFVSTNLIIDGKTVEPSFLLILGQESSVSIGETTLTIVVQRHAEENTMQGV